VLLHWPQRQIQLEQQLQEAQSGYLAGVEQALLAQANTFGPEEELILEALMRGYIYDERLDEAQTLVNEWVKRRPEGWLAWYYRGLTHQAKRLNNKAEADLEHVLELNPEQRDSHIVLGLLYHGEGRYQEAAEHLKWYLGRVPYEADALYALASCQSSLGQMAESRLTLERLLKHHPNHAAGLLLQGKLQMTQDEHEAACASLQRAQSLRPNNVEILQNLITALSQQGRTNEAARYDKRLKELRDITQQLGKLKRKIQQEPEDVTLRFQAAQLCLKACWEDESAHWFQTILNLQPNHRATHLALADYFEQHGDSRRAAHHRAKAHEPQEPRRN